jgi:hypothetical protein
VGLDLRLAQVARQVSDGALLVREIELGVQGRRHDFGRSVIDFRYWRAKGMLRR